MPFGRIARVMKHRYHIYAGDVSNPTVSGE